MWFYVRLLRLEYCDGACVGACALDVWLRLLTDWSALAVVQVAIIPDLFVLQMLATVAS